VEEKNFSPNWDNVYSVWGRNGIIAVGIYSMYCRRIKLICANFKFFYSSVAEDSVLLGHDASSQGIPILAF